MDELLRGERDTRQSRSERTLSALWNPTSRSASAAALLAIVARSSAARVPCRTASAVTRPSAWRACDRGIDARVTHTRPTAQPAASCSALNNLRTVSARIAQRLSRQARVTRSTHSLRSCTRAHSRSKRRSATGRKRRCVRPRARFRRWVSLSILRSLCMARGERGTEVRAEGVWALDIVC
jgi:hypothetical protein